MKKTIKCRIEQRLAALNDAQDLSSSPSQKQQNSETKKKISRYALFGKFCRQIPLTLFNMIRPAQKLFQLPD